MRAAKLVEPKKISIQEVDTPKIGKDDVLIKIRAAGICGTDLHIYQGHRPDIALPRVMGHELSGEIAEVGESVTELSAGDHVVIDPVIYCGTCPACRKGKRNVCSSIMCFGCQTDGGFQDYVKVKARDAYKISKNIPFSHAAMAEPFSIAAEILERSDPAEGDRVVVYGAGTIGLCVLQALKMKGAKVLVADLVDSRLERAKKLGADMTVNTSAQDLKDVVMSSFSEGGADIIIEAVGASKLADEAVEIVARGGRIVVIGFDKTELHVSEFTFVRPGIEIRGSVLNNEKFPQVVTWMEQGKIHPESMISKEYPLEKIGQAFEDILADPKSVIKVIVTF